MAKGMSRCCSVRCPHLQTEADQHLPAGLISRCRWFDPDVTSLAAEAGSTAQLEGELSRRAKAVFSWTVTQLERRAGQLCSGTQAAHAQHRQTTASRIKTSRSSGHKRIPIVRCMSHSVTHCIAHQSRQTSFCAPLTRASEVGEEMIHGTPVRLRGSWWHLAASC